MSENIYHDQIIEWSKKTDYSNKLEHPDCSATVSNPLCGDRVLLELELDADVIRSISCSVKGCMLCKASGAILAQGAGGMRLDELKDMRSKLASALKSPADDPGSFPEAYRMFIPVRSHKSRHSCVLLPFDAIMEAVSGLSGPGD